MKIRSLNTQLTRPDKGLAHETIGGWGEECCNMYIRVPSSREGHLKKKDCCVVERGKGWLLYRTRSTLT